MKQCPYHHGDNKDGRLSFMAGKDASLIPEVQKAYQAVSKGADARELAASTDVDETVKDTAYAIAWAGLSAKIIEDMWEYFQTLPIYEERLARSRSHFWHNFGIYIHNVCHFFQTSWRISPNKNPEALKDTISTES